MIYVFIFIQFSLLSPFSLAIGIKKAITDRITVYLSSVLATNNTALQNETIISTHIVRIVCFLLKILVRDIFFAMTL